MSRVRITKDPETRRKELLDAAESLFSELGYDATAVSQIVERVGVRQGTFYHYFQSKEALVEALLTRSTQAIAERIVERIEEAGASLQQRVAASIEVAFNSPATIRLVFEHMDKAQNGALNVKMHLVMSQRLGPLIAALLEEGNQAGAFSVRYPRESADFIIGGITFLMEKEMYTTGHLDWSAMRPAVAALVEQLLGTAPGWLGLERV